MGAVLQAISPSVMLMVAGRSVVGAAVGAASFVVPLYIAELAPATFRGRLVTMNVLFITLGQVVAYVIGWAFAEYGNKETGWRWMVGLGAVPAAIQSVIVIYMPETPRWLVKAGSSAAAKAVVAKVAGDGPGTATLAERVVKEIEVELREEDEARRLRGRQTNRSLEHLSGWSELLAVGRNRRALAIACLLQGLQQLCGFVSAAHPQ
jgi:MFS transporter, SP family, solute carrier family 2 (myo-inositol transporter), member 13